MKDLEYRSGFNDAILLITIALKSDFDNALDQFDFEDTLEIEPYRSNVEYLRQLLKDKVGK